MIKPHTPRYALGEVSYKMVVNSFAVMDEANRRMFLGLGQDSVNPRPVFGVGTSRSQMEGRERGLFNATVGRKLLWHCCDLTTVRTYIWANTFTDIVVDSIQDILIFSHTFECIKSITIDIIFKHGQEKIIRQETKKLKYLPVPCSGGLGSAGIGTGRVGAAASVDWRSKLGRK